MDLLLQSLQQFFRERALECYLVGGALRDLLLGQQPQDLDLVVRNDPEQIARALADTLQGNYVALGLEKGVKRVILPRKSYNRLMIDIAPLHGASMADDLSQRDFTINALALPLDAAALAGPAAQPAQQHPAPLIDPFNGWRDLRARSLRVVQPSVFQRDPLRLLRAIRLCTHLHLSIEPSTARLLCRDASLLIEVVPARIRDELLQMVSLPNAAEAMRMLDTYQLLPSIFPAFYSPDSPVVLSHPLTPERKTWPTLSFMTELLSAAQGGAAALPEASTREQQILVPLLQLSNKAGFKKRWKKSPGGAHPRSALLLLAALLSDLLQVRETPERDSEGQGSQSPPSAPFQTIAAALKRLALGRQAIAFIVLLLQEHSSLWNLEPRPLDRAPWIAARHYFQRFGERGVDLAFFYLARQMAALQGSPPEDAWQAQTRLCINLIDAFYAERHSLIPPPLLDGQTIITRLGLTRGPMIGALLTRTRNAQLDGIIHTRAEALQFVTDQAATLRQKTGSYTTLVK
jgi:tRNA nucleotidyltransferase/poly(A) polymerase